MAPRKPKPELAQAVRKNPARVTKSSTSQQVCKQPNGIYHLERYKDGLLNLEKTPPYLIEIVKSNAESPLLRLPAELRNEIWSLVCGGQLVTAAYMYCGIDTNNCRGGALSYTNFGRPVKEPSTFHLPRVCRQIYSETALLSYKANTFVLDHKYYPRSNLIFRLLAVQRREITTIQPTPNLLHSMVWYEPADLRKKKGLLKALPNVRTLVVSTRALRRVQQSIATYRWFGSPGERGCRDEWRAWLVGHMGKYVKVGIKLVFEDET